MSRAAFIGWQNYMLQPLDKGRQHMEFGQWLKTMGLGDGPPDSEMTPEQIQEMKEQALAGAAAIVDLDKRRRERLGR